MNLNDFVTINGNEMTIRFPDKQMAILENLLNAELSHVKTIDFFLKRLYFLGENRNHSAVLDAYIESELGGYWEEEYLKENNLEHGWFSFLYYDFRYEGYTNRSMEKVYIIDDWTLEPVLAEIPFDDFVSMLSSGKSSCNLRHNNKKGTAVFLQFPLALLILSSMLLARMSVAFLGLSGRSSMRMRGMRLGYHRGFLCRLLLYSARTCSQHQECG